MEGSDLVAVAADVMVRHPKCLHAGSSVAEARAALADDHVHLVLLVDDRRVLRGTLRRGDLPSTAYDAEPAAAYATLDGRTVAPERPAEAARLDLVAAGSRRLAVTDDHGVLLGLLCLKASGDGFCSDDDVAARADEARALADALVTPA